MIDFVDLMEGRSLGSMDSEADQDKFWFSDQWIMEPIYAGIRFQGLVDTSGKIKFHGKQKQYKQQDKVQALSNIVQSLENCKLPDETLFEGYLTFNNNKTEAYRFLKLENLDQRLIDDAQFYVTDIIYYAGRDVFSLSLFDRKSIIKKIFKETDYLKVQQYFSVDKRNVFREFERQQIKTFLFKDLAAQYKFKQSVVCRIFTVPKQYFMVVMGYVENKEKEELKNMVVALEGGQLKSGQLTKIMNVPVHSNDSRIILFNNKDKIQGKVFEILASEKTEKDVKYQEARFICMRDDKKLEDCVF
jgi:ATP-dependent DNA ligase